MIWMAANDTDHNYLAEALFFRFPTEKFILFEKRFILFEMKSHLRRRELCSTLNAARGGDESTHIIWNFAQEIDLFSPYLIQLFIIITDLLILMCSGLVSNSTLIILFHLFHLGY